MTVWNYSLGIRLKHDTLLHSTAHLMAQAVKTLYPNAMITIGPTIKNGFYYDFDVESTFSEENLLEIEQKMKELAKSGQEIKRKEISVKDAISLFENIGEDYKVEIIKQIDPNDIISAYTKIILLIFVEDLMYLILLNKIF